MYDFLVESKCFNKNTNIVVIKKRQQLVKNQMKFTYTGKKNFLRNPLYSKNYAELEADNEIDTSNIGNKKTNVYKQNPLCNGYFRIKQCFYSGC